MELGLSYRKKGRKAGTSSFVVSSCSSEVFHDLKTISQLAVKEAGVIGLRGLGVVCGEVP